MAETPLLIDDPGHGGSDPGAVGILFPEEDMTLQIGLYQYHRFQELGVPVAITRDRDVDVEPSVRAKMVRNSGAKYCLSNHINAGGGTGAEAWVSIYSNQKWARLILDELVAVGWHHRGIKTRTLPNNPTKDYLFMHRETGSVETVLMEWGFIDSADAANLVKNWQVYAEAGVKATCTYLGFAYSPPKSNDPLKEAVELLRSLGIIASPEYWEEVARPGQLANGEYVGLLIQKIATKLKEAK